MPRDRYTLEEALHGLEIPEEIRNDLVLIDLPYISFVGTEEIGQLVVHQDLESDLKAIFAELVALRFPIEKMIPIVAYDWDDERSMQDNNTSAFNYRLIIGTGEISNHSWGRAIDINPRLNPYHARDGNVYPYGAVLNPSVPGTITADSPVIPLFTSRGWVWGGTWKGREDYQHFQKEN